MKLLTPKRISFGLGLYLVLDRWLQYRHQPPELSLYQISQDEHFLRRKHVFQTLNPEPAWEMKAVPVTQLDWLVSAAATS